MTATTTMQALVLAEARRQPGTFRRVDICHALGISDASSTQRVRRAVDALHAAGYLAEVRPRVFSLAKASRRRPELASL